jgi:hypothetical protein
MTNPYTAAGDPLFWLHHCNIDRLWQVWLNMPARSNPADPEWLDREQFHFHDPAGRDVAHRVRQVIATTDLGYSYEDLTVAGVSLLEVRVPASATPSHPPEMVGASDRAMVLRGGRASVAFDMRPPVGPLAALGAARSPSVFLNLEDIQADENPGVSYAVFVNLPDDVDLTDDTFYVGNVALFGVEMARDLDRDHPGGHGLRYAFDITDLVGPAPGRGPLGRVPPDRDPGAPDAAAVGRPRPRFDRGPRAGHGGPGQRLPPVTRLLWHHPEWTFALLPVGAWVLSLRAHHVPPVVMVVAMMVPPALPMLRYVALSSLWRRRYRAPGAVPAPRVGPVPSVHLRGVAVAAGPHGGVAGGGRVGAHRLQAAPPAGQPPHHAAAAVRPRRRRGRASGSA